MEVNPRPLVLYHDQCLDGIVAAWIAWRRFFDKADYEAVRYGQRPPDCKGRVVYILDFSYTPDKLGWMADEAYRIVMLDHHVTAIDRFKTWVSRKNVDLHFDITKSGAALTSEYFNATARIWIVDYAEDQDLWRFALPHSREVNAMLASSCLFMDAIDAFHVLNEIRGMSMKEVVRQGTGAHAQIEAYARQVKREAKSVDFAGFPNIPCVNIARPMNSFVLDELAKGKAFAAGWYQEGDNAVFSLRSNRRFNVAELAERFGGGGHRDAAGFTIPFEGAAQFFRGQVPKSYDPTELSQSPGP
jgi:oligoribonuclease NrnB/cAMP/cGMP phosphodiesterase (DHH superfamily)